MADEIQISAGDLCQALVEEFAYSLAVVKQNHPATVVHSVKLRLGQTDKPSAQGEGSFSLARKMLLLKDRYPQSQKGWELELELGENPAVTARGEQVRKSTLSTSMLIDLVADYPLSSMDGIDSHWASVLAANKLFLLKDLARLSDDEMYSLFSRCKSLKVREFRQKVLLLKMPLPFVPACSDIGDTSVLKLLRLSVSGVHRFFGLDKVSKSEVSAIIAAVDVLNLVLDNPTLQKLSIKHLSSTLCQL